MKTRRDHITRNLISTPSRELGGVHSEDETAQVRLRRPDDTGERVFFIENLLVRIHSIVVMIRWTGLALWAFEFSFPGSLTSTFLVDT